MSESHRQRIRAVERNIAGPIVGGLEARHEAHSGRNVSAMRCMNRDVVARTGRPKPDRSTPVEPLNGLTGRRKPHTVSVLDLREQSFVEAAPQPLGGEAAVVPVDDDASAE